LIPLHLPDDVCMFVFFVFTLVKRLEAVSSNVVNGYVTMTVTDSDLGWLLFTESAASDAVVMIDNFFWEFWVFERPKGQDTFLKS